MGLCPAATWASVAPAPLRLPEAAGAQTFHTCRTSAAALLTCHPSAVQVVDFFRHVFGEAALEDEFKPYPLLLAHHERVLGLGRMREWRDTGRKEEFLDWEPYAKSVRATLD